MFDTDELHHYGILGMRWGVRKGKGTPKAKVEKPRQVDDRELEIHRINMYKNRDKMTTKQLQAQVNRIRAEKELKKLVYEDEIARKRAADEKRKRNIQRVGTVLEVVGNIALENNFTVDAGKFKSKEEAKAYQKQRRETIRAVRTGAATLGKIMKGASNVKQSGLNQNDVYIPGLSRPDDELHHYGVVGMKWGVHRSARRAAKSETAGLKRAIKQAQVDLGQAQYHRHKTRDYANGNFGLVKRVLNRHMIKGAKMDLKMKKQKLKDSKRQLKALKKDYKLSYDESYKRAYSKALDTRQKQVKIV